MTGAALDDDGDLSDKEGEGDSRPAIPTKLCQRPRPAPAVLSEVMGFVDKDGGSVDDESDLSVTTLR